MAAMYAKRSDPTSNVHAEFQKTSRSVTQNSVKSRTQVQGKGILHHRLGVITKLERVVAELFAPLCECKEKCQSRVSSIGVLYAQTVHL